MLYAAGKAKIDAGRRAGGRQRRDVAGRLGRHQRDPARRHGARRCAQLALALDAGAVPLHDSRPARMVRAREAGTSTRGGSGGAVEALFRTDLDLKSSGGDPRVLLERLVVELCGRGRMLTAVGHSRCRTLRRAADGGFLATGRQARLVAGRGVAVDELLAGHLVDERDRCLRSASFTFAGSPESIAARMARSAPRRRVRTAGCARARLTF